MEDWRGAKEMPERGNPGLGKKQYHIGEEEAVTLKGEKQTGYFERSRPEGKHRGFRDKSQWPGGG